MDLRIGKQYGLFAKSQSISNLNQQSVATGKICQTDFIEKSHAIPEVIAFILL